ncbi:MAG: corrinoid protein [Deltaproteobacteria bacterium]|nr:corrinoid protein [Deltaproteobacteria bacterium]
MGKRLEEIKEKVILGKFQDIEALVDKAVTDGLSMDSIINDALIAAMDVVGDRFGKGEIFVPEMLVSAKTMKAGLDILRPQLQADEGQFKGRVALCTVKGDLHDIGKNLVAMMLEGAGFEVIDMGVDTNVESVLQNIKEIHPHILGLSALLTTTMPEMQRVINELAEEGLRDQVKVMIGGAPISAEFARDIGADAFGKDAAEAVSIARRFTNP